MDTDRPPFDEASLREKLAKDSTNWEARSQLAHGLYDKEAYEEAADIIWNAAHIPSTDLDLAFAIRILAKAQPRRAIRLLTALLELNRGKATENLAMANALLHLGMVLQAIRFYGVALDADPTVANPDLEHFLLWSDDECTMWNLFEKNRPKLGELPWMLRDPKEALQLTSQDSLHTTPISVPDLPAVAAEKLKYDMYQQRSKKNAEISPPPAVTTPMDHTHTKEHMAGAASGETPTDLPISESSVPTSLLHVKWGAPPAKPGEETPPAVAPPTPPTAVPHRLITPSHPVSPSENDSAK